MSLWTASKLTTNPSSPITIEPSVVPLTPDQEQAKSGYDDDSKTPEVLTRARGQSVPRTLDSDDKVSVEMEYQFGPRSLKANVPRKTQSGKARCKLAIEHVIGYNGHDNLCRNNLFVLHRVFKKEKVLYTVGSMAVIHDLESNEQALYTEHCSAITSITVHPKSNVIASASRKGSMQRPVIRMWDAVKMKTVSKMNNDAMIGDVRHLTFSTKSSFLYMVCGENGKTSNLLAFNRGNKLVVNVPFERGLVLGMLFSERKEAQSVVDSFVVFGSGILYWCWVDNINDNAFRCRYAKGI